jgi:hypothetical protein
MPRSGHDELRAAAADAAEETLSWRRGDKHGAAPKAGRSPGALEKRAARARYRQKARQAAFRRLAQKHAAEFRQMFEEELGER